MKKLQSITQGVQLSNLSVGLCVFSSLKPNKGDGVIFYDGDTAWAIPCPKAAWADQRRGNWRIKPTQSDGKPTPLFLLARAFTLSVFAELKSKQLLAPIDCPENAAQDQKDQMTQAAWLQMAQSRVFKEWALDARAQAITSCALVMDERASSLTQCGRSFISWFMGFLKKLKIENHTAYEVVKKFKIDLKNALISKLNTIPDEAFIKADSINFLGLNQASPDLDKELQDLCSTISRLTSETGTPPTKARLFKALRDHPQLKLYDTPNRFGELLKRVGFQWLPNERAGRPKKPVV